MDLEVARTLESVRGWCRCGSAALPSRRGSKSNATTADVRPTSQKKVRTQRRNRMRKARKLVRGRSGGEVIILIGAPFSQGPRGHQRIVENRGTFRTQLRDPNL